MKRIYAHTLVKNEERWLWFAVNSVAPYVDKILLWDTGSTDKSIKIEKSLVRKYQDKINFRQIGEVDQQKFTKVRQEMLDESNCDWVMILDGDEVWWRKNIKRAIEIINKRGDKLESLVHKYYNLVGDVYHYQEQKAGRYCIDGVTGHITIRFFNRKIPGLHFSKPHGTEGIFDDKGVLIQERDYKKRLHLDDYYLHFTHLTRSSTVLNDKGVIKRNIKYKYELGIPFPKVFKYPETFYKKRPVYIPNPWQKRSKYYFFRALFETPIRKIKRRIWKGKTGY